MSGRLGRAGLLAGAVVLVSGAIAGSAAASPARGSGPGAAGPTRGSGAAGAARGSGAAGAARGSGAAGAARGSGAAGPASGSAVAGAASGSGTAGARSTGGSAGGPAGGGLPAWAIGPFTRYAGNPVLTPPTVPTAATEWEWPEAFNPGVVVVGGVFHMLYRGAASGNYSSIGAATSTDGHHFTPAPGNPVIKRTLPSETHGVEDPRLYYLDGKYYAFFTGYNGTTTDINEAVSANAVNWQQIGPVIDGTKNAAVVADPQGTPVKIGGHYLMYYGQTGGTYLAESSDLQHWSTLGAVNPHFPASYVPYEFCVAVTGYQTTAGGPVHNDIDLFVAGELMGHRSWFYAISEIEFSRAGLTSAAAQLHVPALFPQAPYEIYGFTPHTVFMNDIAFYRGQWWMFYGAGDSVTALANAPLRSGT
jgi:predicted GH43/DUF377 family glycosyl hydrolase